MGVCLGWEFIGGNKIKPIGIVPHSGPEQEGKGWSVPGAGHSVVQELLRNGGAELAVCSHVGLTASAACWPLGVTSSIHLNSFPRVSTLSTCIKGPSRSSSPPHDCPSRSIASCVHSVGLVSSSAEAMATLNNL